MSTVATPHYLLFSEASTRTNAQGAKRGRWRFVLEAVEGSFRFEAADDEPETLGDRLDLLSVVRGLEAIDQPAKVTLITPSGYVSRGLRFGLEQWRENGWQWESFGQWKPVKNDDLWRRIDRALAIHQVEVRAWRFDQAGDADHHAGPAAEAGITSATVPSGIPAPSRAFRNRMGQRFADASPERPLAKRGQPSDARPSELSSVWGRLRSGAQAFIERTREKLSSRV